MRKKFLKIILLMTAAAVTGIVMFQAHDSYIKSVELEFYEIHIGPQSHLQNQNETRECKLPAYEPYDPSILKYIKKWPRISCGQPQLPLTFLDDSGFIHINATAKRILGTSKKNVQCYFHAVKRKANDDAHIELGPPQEIIKPVKVVEEFIVVKCYAGKPRRKLYESGHAQVIPLSTNLNEISKKTAMDKRFNVLIMVFDSMSQLNFIRQLPKTYEVITNKFKAITLRGIMKVGDNTYPNMLVLLSGLASSRHHIDKSLGPFFGNENASRGNFDELPAVWKNFSSQGYVTMYAEDLPEFSTFNYLAKGFFKPPTNYYMRPFWLAMEQQNKFKSQDNRCFSHVPKHQFLLNYTEQFLKHMHKGKNAYFALTFLTALSHDNINSIQVIDNDLASLFSRLFSSGALQDTIFFLMGDHGNRFDAIRKTVIGRVEERMPFLAITLPDKLEHFRKKVEANSKKLSSWHDAYQTLMNIAMNNLTPDSKQVQYGNRGLSFFGTIPSNRTCWEVGVPREYCVCWIERELNPMEARAVDAGKMLIKYVNRILVHHTDVCMHLSLDHVVNAQLLLPSDTVSTPSSLEILVRVTVKARPSGALFEATLEQRAWSKGVVGDVNRINQYGNESACLEDKSLRLYCYCSQLALEKLSTTSLA